MRRYALRDDQWDRIKDFLPGREGHVGGTAADNRSCFIPIPSGHSLARSAGALWGLEDRSSTLWSMGEERSFRAHFQAVGERSRQRIHDDRCHHRARSPAQRRRTKKNGAQAIGRSRGGLTTKIHVLVDALGNPVDVMLTPGQAHDLACAELLIDSADPEALIGDKAYDADPLIDTLKRREITPVIPPKAHREIATSRFIANATSSSASSTNSSTFVPSLRAMTNWPLPRRYRRRTSPRHEPCRRPA